MLWRGVQKVTSKPGFLLRAMQENDANPDWTKEQQGKVHADTSQAIKRLEREQEDLEREGDQEGLAGCDQLAEAHPTMLEEGVEAAWKAQQLLQTPYDRTLTLPENDHTSLSLAAFVTCRLAEHFPATFTVSEARDRKHLAELRESMGDGKEARGLRRDATIFSAARCVLEAFRQKTHTRTAADLSLARRAAPQQRTAPQTLRVEMCGRLARPHPCGLPDPALAKRS